MNGHLNTFGRFEPSITSTNQGSNFSRDKPFEDENLTYRLTSNNDNSSPTFGSIGRIPEVVDPDFRQPNMYPSNNPTNLFNNIATDHQPSNFIPNQSDDPLPSTSSSTFIINMPSTPSYNSNNGNGFIGWSNEQQIHKSAQLDQSNSDISGLNFNEPSSNGPNTYQTNFSKPSSTSGSSLAFSDCQQGLNFSDLAKAPRINNHDDPMNPNIMSATLNEYGPPIPEPIPSINNHRLPFMAGAPIPRRFPEFPSAARPTRTSSYQQSVLKNSEAPGWIPVPPNVNIPLPDEPNRRQADRSASSFAQTSTNQERPSTSSDRVCSADKPNSNNNVNNSGVSSITNQDGDRLNHVNCPGIIPKKVQKSNEKYDNLDMLSLQKTYREFESKQRDNQRERAAIEKALNDMTRKAQGKNVEMDPTFRQKKEEQKRCNLENEEIKSNMKKISEKLWKKFSFKITAQAVPTQQSRRAKMSTGATPKEPSVPIGSSKKFGKYKFDLIDDRVWCKTCDIHYKSLKEYCEHLHKREHQSKIEKPATPWRSTKEPASRRRTYDMLKSICAKLDNEFHGNFPMAQFEKILNPGIKDGTKLKSLILNRERGKFDDSDTLFRVKGFDYLLPITGYYCTLCDRTLCDYTEVEQHIKGHYHNLSYARNVALNSQQVKSFQLKMEKSYNIQHGSSVTEQPGSVTNQQAEPEKSNDKQPEDQATRNVVNFIEADIIGESNIDKDLFELARSANAPYYGQSTHYKKLTSHIVDDHETLGRFSKTAKSTSEQQTSKSQQDRVIRKIITKSSSKSSTLRKNLPVPAIIPIGDAITKPSALKRLRTEWKGPSKPVRRQVSPTSSSSSSPCLSPTLIINSTKDFDDNVESNGRADSPEEVHMAIGDPNSPFPELDLCVTGNLHVNHLKDKRIGLSCWVRLNRINIDDYRDILLDETTLWTRVNEIMAKKEPSNLTKELLLSTATEPTFFDAEGSSMPIDLGFSGDSDNSDT